MCLITQTQNVKFDLFDLVTLDILDLTQSHKRPRRVLRSISDRIHIVSSALFHSLRLPCPAIPAMTEEMTSNGKETFAIAVVVCHCQNGKNFESSSKIIPKLLRSFFFAHVDIEVIR